MTHHFIIDYDQDADFSWLQQSEFANENPADHVALYVALFDANGTVIDSLSNIDFLEAEDNWTTGRFNTVEEIPARCEYLREIAADMLSNLSPEIDDSNAHMPGIDDGNAHTTTGYKVCWDNGNHASGEFEDIFFSYAAAERFGESWQREMCAIDGIDPDGEADTYSFDVIQIVEPKP
jgi:hypothetical protein